MQVVLAVVAPGEHLQHRLARRDAVLEPLGQEAHDLLGDGRQGLDPPRPVGDVAVGRERGELVADAEQDVGALRVHGRLVEPAEPDAAGQVADRPGSAAG